MSKFITSDKIYIDKSKIPKSGRGVFASVEIKKGEIIEHCPFIETSKEEAHILNNSSLVNYFFYFGKMKEKIALVLGFGSLYNHSNKPNSTFKINSKEKIVDFIAIKNIKKDDEITFDYRHNSKLKTPLWFEI